jgi:predicted porin
MFGIASGNFISASNVLSHIGVGSNGAARFHERYANSIQYQTAEFKGIQAGIQYVPDEARGTPGRGLNQHVWSYGVKYDSQIFYASLHQEQKWDFLGASTNIPAGNTTANSIAVGSNTRSKDTATRFSSEVRFLGSQRVVLDIARLHYTETGQVSAGKFEEYRKTNWALGYDGGFGAWRFATQFIRAGSGSCRLTGGTPDCSTNGLQSTMVTLGTRYRFDRQTFVYVIAAKLNNGNSAAMSNVSAYTANRGEDTRTIAAGISYSF